MAGGDLGLRASVRRGRYTLALTGELDEATTPILKGAVSGACSGGAAEIALDLTELHFMDSTGLLALVHAYKQCKQEGRGFMVAPGTGQPWQLFEACGMFGVAPFLELPRSAAARGRSPPTTQTQHGVGSDEDQSA
jgi:anti-sigma B factor antagonist